MSLCSFCLRPWEKGVNMSCVNMTTCKDSDFFKKERENLSAKMDLGSLLENFTHEEFF